MKDQELEQTVIQAAAGRSWSIDHITRDYGNGLSRMVRISLWKAETGKGPDGLWQTNEVDSNDAAWEAMLDLMTAPTEAKPGAGEEGPGHYDFDGSEAAQDELERRDEADREAAEAASHPDDGIYF